MGYFSGGNSNIFGIFTPTYLEKRFILTFAYFSDGVGEKPPTSEYQWVISP